MRIIPTIELVRELRLVQTIAACEQHDSGRVSQLTLKQLREARQAYIDATQGKPAANYQLKIEVAK